MSHEVCKPSKATGPFAAASPRMELARLGAAAEVGALAGAVDLLAQGADAGDVVDRVLLALPLEVGEDDEDEGDGEGRELRAPEAVVPQLVAEGTGCPGRQGHGAAQGGNTGDTRRCLRRSDEGDTREASEGKRREAGEQQPCESPPRHSLAPAARWALGLKAGGAAGARLSQNG
eukprot:CAMPEP_0204533790 /NCGR_PEP_ID=MMETSP0661-20131031/12491_1 /ASSEMBLY_ACC=CAM_ASM_000606 /TAXON_ID=109239 /ORGANISM="Alexandrium margalefi, Strain AMGDE01CS-322" /LENGTH=174 /DNA_ID=CAMNT_0051540173 /DNA_START=69 /DNA_END=591 /DNA_ORIENTATION=-